MLARWGEHQPSQETMLTVTSPERLPEKRVIGNWKKTTTRRRRRCSYHAHLRPATRCPASRMMAATRTKVSFWPNGSTSSGNYGYEWNMELCNEKVSSLKIFLLFIVIHYLDTLLSLVSISSILLTIKDLKSSLSPACEHKTFLWLALLFAGTEIYITLPGHWDLIAKLWFCHTVKIKDFQHSKWLGVLNWATLRQSSTPWVYAHLDFSASTTWST
jgi:hypothetical protein